MTDTQNTSTITDAAVNQAAENMIAQAAAKAGIAITDVPAYAIEDAKRTALEMLQSEARKQSNEYFHLYEAQRVENETLKAQLGAVRENRVAATDTRVVQSMERTRDLMGRAVWFQLTEAQKVSALGVDPATVDKQLLRTLFGKNTDTAAAVDYAKANPYKYRQFREVSLALNITGK